MRRFIVGGVAVAVAAALTIMLFLSDDHKAHREQILTPERADELTTQLASGDKVTVREAIALPPDQDLSDSFVKELAKLGLVINESTFQQLSPDHGTVEATTTNGATEVWTVRLANIDGTWFIVSTAPKDAP